MAALLLVLAAIAPPAGAAENDDDPAKRFLARMAELSAAAEKNRQFVLEGRDGWLFFAAELRALSAGPFWGEHAARVSRSGNPRDADPLEPIVDFHKQLQGAGIELLVVPVPAKAAVYPGQVAAGLERPDGPAPLDSHHQRFYELLRDRGVQVIDLLPVLADEQSRTEPTYCRTDTHWSGRATRLTARLLANHVKDREWLGTMARKEYFPETRHIEITGDLAQMQDETNPARETLPLTFVREKAGSGLRTIEPWRQSPVLLIGDSHTLVFHDPALHAEGAGLPDHLAHEFGFPVDLVGVRGSGATTTRISLLRRQDNLAGKKLVIWCFSMREFTESFSGWRQVPVIRKQSAPTED